jgi:hypothetical protein
MISQALILTGLKKAKNSQKNEKSFVVISGI